jgi:hypothetical protein
MGMIASSLEKLCPRIMPPVLQIVEVIFMQIGFLLKRNVMIGTPLLPVKQSNNTVFHEIPQIEEDIC